MAEPTHYEILGIAAEASPAGVRRAYRHKARLFHPDVSRVPDAAARFARLNAAYEVLSDPARRREYDRLLASGAAPAAHAGVPVHNHTARFNWANIGADAAPPPGAPRGRTDLDEMYDAFFRDRAGPDDPPDAPG